MSALLPAIDHCAEGLSRIITQYKGKPKFRAKLAVLLWQIQLLENALHSTVEAWDPLTATGFRLDILGDRVGQPRIGSDDDTYRAFIRGRIRSNRSLGQVEDLQVICQILMPGYAYDEGPNEVRIDAPLGGLIAGEAYAAWVLLDRARPQGIRLSLTWTPSTTTQVLRRASALDCAGTAFAAIPGGHAPATPDTYVPGQYAAYWS